MDLDERLNYNLPEPGNSLCSTNYGFIELGETDFCLLDAQTISDLELLHNNIDLTNKRHSLFGYLSDFTATSVGVKLLREAISKPLCHLATLEHRLDCIEYLINRVDVLGSISGTIRRFGQIDLNTIVPTLVNLYKHRGETIALTEKRLDIIRNVEIIISQVESIVASLELADQPTLNIYKVALQDQAYTQILDDIHNFVDLDLKHSRGKRGRMYCIKQGVEPLFDIARSTYNVAISDMEQYVRELQRDDNLPWRLNYGESRGYYLNMAADKVPKSLGLNTKYICVVKNRSMVSCTTRELMQLNVRASVSYENSMKMANEILVGALSTILTNITPIFKLVDIIGMLDLVTSFAKLITTSESTLVRPKFTSSETVVEDSRHPVLESVLRLNNLEVTPNNIRLDPSSNFMLITGPNMGGKSIFLKQVALIQIMAQIGCYVPAASAHIKIVNRIVSRSGSSDDNSSNCSSFMWEMKGIASALQTNKSPDYSCLYIIDEVGRGTSLDYGASYSFAIAEELAFRTNSFTLFATHFDQVFKLATMYKSITPYHFRYDEEVDDQTGKTRIKISHDLVPGFGRLSNYGIKLAETCGFPEMILEFAAKNYHD